MLDTVPLEWLWRNLGKFEEQDTNNAVFPMFTYLFLPSAGTYLISGYAIKHMMGANASKKQVLLYRFTLPFVLAVAAMDTAYFISYDTFDELYKSYKAKYQIE